ncbi:hypothetical protein L0222_05475 [bacterium]|nr:hypothetical protein [bacterium]MCI0603580.1 hypothetical protein [bacterium]
MNFTKVRSSFLIVFAILVAFSLAVLMHVNLYKKYRANETFLSPLLYLPSGKYLKPASFGYHALLADFIYLWSIQYYGDPGFKPRMEYIKHTYDLITELDPQYMDAYHMGALFLFYEGRNPKAGLQLLDQGLRKNPDKWALSMDAGYYCMMTIKDKELAYAYFDKTSKIPGAPPGAKRIAASMRFKLGDRKAALALWTEVYEIAITPSDKQSAHQHVHDLTVLVDVDTIRAAISAFHEKFGRMPLNLEQLVAQRFLQQVPLDPEGNEYEYDPKTGNVKYTTQLTLYSRYQ